MAQTAPVYAQVSQALEQRRERLRTAVCEMRKGTVIQLSPLAGNAKRKGGMLFDCG